MEIRNHHFLPFNVAIQDWPYQSGRTSSFAVSFFDLKRNDFFFFFSDDEVPFFQGITWQNGSFWHLENHPRSLRCKKCWKSRWNNNETISLEMIERLQSMGKICAQKTKEKYFRGENEMRNWNKCYILGSTFSRKLHFCYNS
jgi:hypothetical protein